MQVAPKKEYKRVRRKGLDYGRDAAHDNPQGDKSRSSTPPAQEEGEAGIDEPENEQPEQAPVASRPPSAEVAPEVPPALPPAEAPTPELPPDLPRRKVVPAKGKVDKFGRRQALDFGRPPEHENDPRPSRPSSAEKVQEPAAPSSSDSPETADAQAASRPASAESSAGQEGNPPDLPPNLPRRKIIPAKGKVDKYGRRQALDFGRPPDHENDPKPKRPVSAEAKERQGWSPEPPPLPDPSPSPDDEQAEKQDQDSALTTKDKFAAAVEPVRPRSSLQNAVGWFVRRRDNYYVDRNDEEDDEGMQGDGGKDAAPLLPVGSGREAAKALKVVSGGGEDDEGGLVDEARRRSKAAVKIQRTFRVFLMQRKFYILTSKRRREMLIKAGEDPFDTQQFGPDSLAARKPVEVTKYIKDNKIENFIVEQVSGYLDQNFLSTNPYPELLIRMRMRQILDTEYLTVSDADLRQRLKENSANVREHALDGRLLAAAYFTNLPATRTFWGNKHIMKSVDAEAFDQLRDALGSMCESKVYEPDDGLKMVVGRVLVGRCIYHARSMPFPASFEITDECLGIGANFEKIMDTFAEHVMEDLEEVERSCVHSLLSPLFVGIATPEGEFQRFNKWDMRDLRAKKKALVSELNNATVNKRPNRIDLLLRVRMRPVPGAQSQESEQAAGGWGFVVVRKTYAFHYQQTEGGVTRSYVDMPFRSLYRGIFFEKEFAQLYASKQLSGGLGGIGKTTSRELIDPFLEMMDAQVATADREGDTLFVAELSLAPAMLREATGAIADERTLIRAERMRQCGAARLRTLCDHIFAMEKAVDMVDEAAARRKELEARGGVYLGDDKPSARAQAGGYDEEGTMRVVMGQMAWLVRELGDLVGSCTGGIDLDTLSPLILGRFSKIQSTWTVEGRVSNVEVLRTVRWARNVLRSCYVSHAQNIFIVDPIKVKHVFSVTAIEKFEKLIIKDVINIEQEVAREIKSLHVPKGKAKETVLLRYVVDTGMDTFLERLLRELTDSLLFPNPRMRAMRHMRSYSQYFLLWKAFNVDILDTFGRLEDAVEVCDGMRAMLLHVHQCFGLPPMQTPPGQPHPRIPQPGLWPPPDTPPTLGAYGSKVALQAWFALICGVGAGAEPRKNKDGSYEVSSGAAAHGGAHFNTGYSPKIWWLAHSDVADVVEALRNGKPFPKNAYTIKLSMGVRQLCVHPAPYTPVMQMRFSSIVLYEYYDMEGPNKAIAVQFACAHFMDHIKRLHDATNHIPFGIYIAPKRSEHSCPPSGLVGPLGEVELPGKGHIVWSPAQAKQMAETVIMSMRKAILEGRSVYSVGLYYMDPPTMYDSKEKDKLLSPGYILYHVYMMTSYSPSSAAASGRELLPSERDVMWPRDDHALFNLIFFSKREATDVMQLFPVEDHEHEPCSEVNSQKHYEGLIESMQVYAHEGNYVDLMHTMWQRGHLVAHHLGLNKIMRDRSEFEKNSKAAFASGRHYLDTLFARQQPELAALTDAFRVMHSTTENLNTLQWSLLCLGAMLAVQAPEVRMKVRMSALLTQANQLKRRLTNLVLEEPNKIFLNGLHRSLYLRIDEFLADIRFLADNPHTFADSVAASSPTQENNFVAPDLETAGQYAVGRASDALNTMREMHTSLASILLAISRTTFESCEMVTALLAIDVKKRVELNTAKRQELKEKEAAQRAQRSYKVLQDAAGGGQGRSSSTAHQQADDVHPDGTGGGGRLLHVAHGVEAGVAWSKLKDVQGGAPSKPGQNGGQAGQGGADASTKASGAWSLLGTSIATVGTNAAFGKVT